MTPPDYLPGRPHYYRIKLDERPLGVGLPETLGSHPTLTFHSFKRLKRGDRVCIKAGMFEGVFGTVKRKSFRKGYTYRAAKSRRIVVTELPLPPMSFSVEVG